MTAPSRRSQLLLDAEYFSNELLKRLTTLEQVEPNGRYRSHWQRVAGTTRKIRGYLRQHQDLEQRKRKRAAQIEAIRR